MTSPAIQTSGLCRRFGELEAVAPLDLEVRRGEVLGFLGPNGAGKTTCTRMLSTLLEPTAGSAIVLGHDLEAGADRIRARIGVLTEQPGLHPRLTPREHLRLFAGLHGLSAASGRVTAVLAALGLSDVADRPMAGFSKGQGQKVALARTLLHDPDLIFLDEPTSGLDVDSCRVVRDLVLELKSQGKTIFMATHLMDEAERLCDRVAIFRHHLLALDTPDVLRGRFGGQRVAVQLDGPPPDLMASLRHLPWIRDAAWQDGELMVRVDRPETCTPDLVNHLVSRGARVRQVRPATATLEEAVLGTLGLTPGSEAP
ncbi:MAG: ABC transporter ATP-binding protein [Candidatus Sericytochromatia bacterium]|nr:ABC transporter ATP-binding protein [Candidatus Sericytochromatia bacterium]